jgi:hypothetical protein
MAKNPSPKHGSSPKTFPERDKSKSPEDHASESQADGTAAEAPRGETQSQPSGVGPTGEHPATAGLGPTEVRSETPENRTGQINPSGPANGTEGAMTNMGSITEGLPENPNMNSFGEVGEPTGKGNMDIRWPETYKAPEPDHKAGEQQSESKKQPGKQGAKHPRRQKKS